MQITVIGFMQQHDFDGCYVKSASNQTPFGFSKGDVRVAWSLKSYLAVVRKIKNELKAKLRKSSVAMHPAITASYEARLERYYVEEWKRKAIAEHRACLEFRDWLIVQGPGTPQWSAAEKIVYDCMYIEAHALYEQHAYVVDWCREHGEVVANYIRVVRDFRGPRGDFDPPEGRSEDERQYTVPYTDELFVAPQPMDTRIDHKWLRERNYTLTVLHMLIDTWRLPLVDALPVPVVKLTQASGAPTLHPFKGKLSSFSKDNKNKCEPWSAQFRGVGELHRFRGEMERACGEWLDARGMLDYDNCIEFDPDAEPTLVRGALRGAAGIAGGGTRVTFGSPPRTAVAAEASPEEVIWGIG